jgi:TatD DNase family protein
MFIDTHVHFDGLEDVDGAINRALAAGVGRMVAVGGSQHGNNAAADLAEKYPGKIVAAAGFDREHAGREIDFPAFELFLKERKISAIGEIGLDYHYHPETAAAQKDLMDRMLQIAAGIDVPAIIHSREADEDTLEVLGRRGDVRGVIHCFSGNREFAEKLVALGFHISFSGIITFRNAGTLREAAKAVPDDKLLIETDSPHLAPEPHRGKKNEPAFVVRVAEELARIKGCSVERIANLTSENASRLFQAYSTPRFAIMFRQIPFESDEYRKECELRQEALRKPIGLNLYDEDLSKEKDQLHFGLFESNGVLVGCVIAALLSPSRARIRQMAVAPEHQGKGYGRVIIEQLETVLLQRGLTDLFMHARMTAVGFYEKLGYVKSGKEIIEVGIPHVRMKKRLQSIAKAPK